MDQDPTLCAPRICAAGLCRVCVEVDGQYRLQASARTPLRPRSRFTPHTRKVRKARRHIIDLMLRNRYGERYLRQEQQLRTVDPGQGIRRRFLCWPACRADVRHRQLVAFVIRDMNKCVLASLRAVPASTCRKSASLKPSTRARHRDRRSRSRLPMSCINLRPVHQQLPDRRPAGHDRRTTFGTPSTTRRSTSSSRRPRPARPSANVSACPRQPADVRDEHGAASSAVSTRSSTRTSRPT